jgi:small subunit ribosomal protein S16
MGRTKIPVFSIVATDSRSARDGRYIEDLGRYYPLEQPARVKLDEGRTFYWLEQGATPSDTVRSILSKRGLMLALHLKRKGHSPAEVQAAVQKHLEALEEKGDEMKMTAAMRREQALEAERQRVAEIEAKEREEAEKRRKAEEEAKKKAEEEARKKAEEEAAAKAAAEAEAAEATDDDTAPAEAEASADADEAASDEEE